MISVIMATYNRADKIGKAIESVLSQTYTDFELIIVDDGSTDDTLSVLRSYSDSRIKIIDNKENIGFVKSLNKAINLAQGKYIARIDDDDYWCDDSKLEKQVKFLESNLEYNLVGCGMIKNEVKYLFKEKDEDIRKTMLLTDQFVHPGVVFRKDAWETAGRYDEKFFFSQDWDLWMRLGKTGKMYNFQEYFVCVGDDGKNRTSKRMRYHLMLNQKIRWRYRKDYPNFLKAYLLGLVVLLLPFQQQIKKLFKWNLK